MSSQRLTIYDRIAPDIIHGIFLLDREACFSDDDSQFTFVVHRLSKSRVGINVCSTSSDASTALGEDSWDLGTCIPLVSCIYSFFKKEKSIAYYQ